MLLVDLDGNVLLSAGGEHDSGYAATLDAVREALATGRPVISDFFFCAAGGDHVHVDVAVGVPDAAGGIMAVLLLRADAETFLYPLIRFWPLPSRSAETVLVQRDGDEAWFLSRTKHGSDPALATRIPLDQGEVPAVRAVLGHVGSLKGVDYRGVRVLAHTLPIPDSPWHLVVKEDWKEAMSEAHFRTFAMAAFIFVLLILAGAMAAYAFRHRQAALYRTLYEFERGQREAQEEIKATLYSIGDGVITTDRDGLVRRMNPVAERLTGWTEAEAQSRPLDEVFRIVNEETRASVESPVHKVLREGGIVDLANHTLLIAKDGTECPIVDSGAPILNSDGEADGVVLVFRDQTAERAAERALRDSERFAQSKIDALSANIAILDEGGVIIGVNKTWREFALANAGTLEGLAEGANYLAVCERAAGPSSEGAAEFAAGIRDVLTHQVAEFTAEHSCHSPDEQRWFVGRVTHFHANGNAYVVVAHENITARKKAEEVQRYQQMMLEEMGRVAKIGGWEFDPATGKGKWTREVAQIQDLDPDGEATVALGLSMFEGESRARIEAAVKEAATVGTPYDLELEMVTAKGERKWVHAIGQPRIENGQVVRVWGSMQDITQRKRDEEAFDAVSGQLQAILDHSPFIICNLSPDGRCLLANKTTCRYLKMSPEAVIGRTFDELVPHATEKLLFERIEQVLQKGEAVLAEDRVQLGGEERLLSGVVFPQFDAAGKVASVGIISQDVTDIRRAEAAQEKLEEQFRQAQKMEAVGRLAGGVAHDFNNMLGVISGHAELALATMSGDGELREDLLSIQTAARRSADLTRHLLAFARQQTIAPVLLDLNDAVAGILKMLRRLIGEDIDLLWRPGKVVWPVKMDPSQIDQLLANLTVNARDAIRGVGRVIIETGTAVFNEQYCETHADFAPGKYALLTVSDNGCGMDKETAAKIFEPFFKGNRSWTCYSFWYS